MKLYYSPFACSMAAHIVCREAAIQIDLLRADLVSKQIEGGGDLAALNPMGLVPILVLDDGTRLTENAAVLLYLADRRPELGLAPAPRTFAQYEVIKWLSFVATELHKKVNSPMFVVDTPDPVKAHARASATKPLSMLETHLSDRELLVGETFSVADAYLFWALTIMPFGGVSLDRFPAVRAYQARQFERPAVAAAVAFERRLHGKPLLG